MSELTLGLSAFALAATLNMALPAFADSGEDTGDVSAVDAGTASAVSDGGDLMEISTNATEGDDATIEESDPSDGEDIGEIAYDDRDNCANCRGEMQDMPGSVVDDGADTTLDDQIDVTDEEPVAMDDGADTTLDDKIDVTDEEPVAMDDGMSPEVYQTAVGGAGGEAVQKNVKAAHGIAERVGGNGGADRELGESKSQCLNRVGKSLTFLCK